MPRRRTQGATLLELLIVTACCALITAAGAAYFRTVRQTSGALTARHEALQNARIALERLGRHIRTAQQVAAISDPADPLGSITVIDAGTVSHSFALQNGQILYGTGGTPALLASGIHALTFQGYAGGAPVAATDPGSIEAVAVTLAAAVAGSTDTVELSTRVRLRTMAAATGTPRISTSYATAYRTTGSGSIDNHWKAYGAQDGDTARKYEGDAGEYYGFQPGSYAGTVYRIYVGTYMKCRSSDKPLTMTVRHGTTVVHEHTLDTNELIPINDVGIWYWLDVTDGRASWTEADISQLSVELWNIADFEFDCFAVRAVFDPTEMAIWQADRQGSGACPNEWVLPGNALGLPNGTFAWASWLDEWRQSFRVTVPSSRATILDVHAVLTAGLDVLLTTQTVELRVALPSDSRDSGRAHIIDANDLNPFRPYANKEGTLYLYVSPDVAWTWDALNSYEIRFRTRKDSSCFASLYTDSVGWRVRYAVSQRGIVAWDE